MVSWTTSLRAGGTYGTPGIRRALTSDTLGVILESGEIPRDQPNTLRVLRPANFIVYLFSEVQAVSVGVTESKYNAQRTLE